MTTVCAQCSSALNEGSLVCPSCGSAVAVNSGITETGSTDAPIFKSIEDPNDLNGIGGWLILPAIGLAISPFISLHGVYRTLEVLTGSHYQAFLSFRPGLAALILFEAITNTILFASLVCLNYLFHTKKRAFPTAMILYFCGQFFLLLIDHLMAMRFNPNAQWTAVARSFFAALIWIPYFLNSRRVEATFVN